MKENELAKKAFEAIKELTSLGYVMIRFEGRNDQRDKKLSRIESESYFSKVTLVICEGDSWDNVTTQIALAYTESQKKEKEYLYKICNPDNYEALYSMIKQDIK
jgi:hypothetical protein